MGAGRRIDLERVGPTFSQWESQIRSQLEDSIRNAYRIPKQWTREAIRVWIAHIQATIRRTLEPELTRKLGHVEVKFEGLHSADLGSRGRVFSQLVNGRLSMEQALRIVELGDMQ